MMDADIRARWEKAIAKAQKINARFTSQRT